MKKNTDRLTYTTDYKSAYEDADVGYHHPRVENINSALRGISAAGCAGHFSGIAIYCEWEMTPEKWQIWRKFTR